MKTVNMKCDEGGDGGAYPTPAGPYPYGLCLSLDDDICEKLGISTALKPGTVLTIQASAVVTSATERLEDDGDDKGNDVSLQVQITDMGCQVNGTMRNAAAELYGSK